MNAYFGMFGCAVSIPATFFLVGLRVKENLLKMQPQRTKEIKEKIVRLDKYQFYTMMAILFAGLCTVGAIIFE